MNFCSQMCRAIKKKLDVLFTLKFYPSVGVKCQKYVRELLILSNEVMLSIAMTVQLSSCFISTHIFTSIFVRTVIDPTYSP